MLRAALKAENWDLAPSLALAAAKAADAARRLVERYGEGQESRQSAAELDALLSRLRRVCFVWEKVDPADRLKVAWVLWSGAQPPAEHDAFLRDFLDWLETPHHRYQAARLALAWAAAIDPRLPSIRLVGDWLAAHLAWLPDPWRRLAERFQLFAVDRAPLALAEEFLHANTTATHYFAATQLPASAVRGGLGVEILADAIAQVAAQAAQEPGLTLRLCDLALAIGVFEPARATQVTARRNDLQQPLAEVLLAPWASQPPPLPIKTSLLTFLLRHYGDLRTMPSRWRALRHPAVAVMQRWLTEATVAAYFRLASRCKSVDRARLMERRQFWLSRLDSIDGAWLLTTGPEGETSAGPIAQGRLGGRPDHVALLLRIGDVTVLELAHETSERIWLAGNPFAPLLYQRSDHVYWPAALAQGVDFSSAYGADGPHAWRARLAAFLDRADIRKVA